MPFSWGYCRPVLSAEAEAQARCSELSNFLTASPHLLLFQHAVADRTKTLQCVSDKPETTGQRGEGGRRNKEQKGAAKLNFELTQTLSLASSVQLKQTSLRPFYKMGGCQRTSHSQLSIPSLAQDGARRKSHSSTREPLAGRRQSTEGCLSVHKFPGQWVGQSFHTHNPGGGGKGSKASTLTERMTCRTSSMKQACWRSARRTKLLHKCVFQNWKTYLISISCPRGQQDTQWQHRTVPFRTLRPACKWKPQTDTVTLKTF